MTNKTDGNSDKISFEPEGSAVRRIIEVAIEEELADSPVRYAFDGEWPVYITKMEAQEVYRALTKYTPEAVPHSAEHKKRAINSLLSTFANQIETSDSISSDYI